MPEEPQKPVRAPEQVQPAQDGETYTLPPVRMPPDEDGLMTETGVYFFSAYVNASGAPIDEDDSLGTDAKGGSPVWTRSVLRRGDASAVLPLSAPDSEKKLGTVTLGALPVMILRLETLKPDSPAVSLDRFNAELRAVLKPLVDRFQKFLDGIEGKNFGFEENEKIAKQIQDTLERLGVLLKCTKVGCGHPARLRCRRSGRSMAGVFQFDHIIDGTRTNHGGSSSFPKMEIIVPGESA